MRVQLTSIGHIDRPQLTGFGFVASYTGIRPAGAEPYFSLRYKRAEQSINPKAGATETFETVD